MLFLSLVVQSRSLEERRVSIPATWRINPRACWKRRKGRRKGGKKGGREGGREGGRKGGTKEGKREKGSGKDGGGKRKDLINLAWFASRWNVRVLSV